MTGSGVMEKYSVVLFSIACVLENFERERDAARAEVEQLRKLCGEAAAELQGAGYDAVREALRTAANGGLEK